MTSNIAKSYQDFWSWFQKNEKAFFRVVKEENQIEKLVFNELSPQLDKVKDGIFYLAGMLDDDTAELVLTADGTVKNIVFVEELVHASPAIAGWKFTALKAASSIEDVSIEMAGHTFNADNISFYAKDTPAYPDEIDIKVVHDDFTEEVEASIRSGVYIFLDNYLGELDFATGIDNLTLIGKGDAQQPMVPIEKLKAFLTWRQKEFTERYEGVRHDTENDGYGSFEAKRADGKRLVAVINTDLLAWEAKASHPWVLTVEVTYDGEQNNGMPNTQTYGLLDEIEDAILAELHDHEGYLNVGRQTADGVREIYFACKEFRKPARVLHQIQSSYVDALAINYDIYKDKYWQSFERFAGN
jgi:hypothetical protein